MKAKELKNKGVKFKVKNKTYNLFFDMNCFCELEEVYEDVDKVFDDLQKRKLKAVRALVYAAIKVEDPDVTLKEVGKMLTLQDMETLGAAINKALQETMPEEDEETKNT